MSNESLKNAMKNGREPLPDDMEVLDDELDDISGGACGTFRCGVYQIT